MRATSRVGTPAAAEAVLCCWGQQTYYSSGSKYYPATQGREYKPCGSSYSYVSVDYKRKNGRWVATSKYAYWG